MDVAIIGASGSCGRQIAIQLVSQRTLSRFDRLQLVGRAQGSSAQTLFGLRTDISDAFAENAPELDVALHPDEVVADIIVMSGGVTIPTNLSETKVDRDNLAPTNKIIFEEYANAIKRNGTGNEVVIIVSNPVELGVAVFSKILGRHRVIGIGAYQDSMRFRREIALDLGIRRQLVQGFVLGQHGDHMLPLWSTVRIHGFDQLEQQAIVKRLQKNVSAVNFHEQLHDARHQMLALLREGLIKQAYALAQGQSPCLRTALIPYITHLSGAKTAIATGQVTAELVHTLMEGRQVLVAGQVQVDGEFQGIHSVTGVPIIIGPGGVERVVPINFYADEARVFTHCAMRTREQLEGWMNQ